MYIIKKINNDFRRDGTFYYKDPECIILHRENGPAVEYANGDKEWYINGKLHREDGPAIERVNGNKFWYEAGKLHRTDGPAIESVDGHKEWRINGKYHREDGPAIIYVSGEKSYYLNNNKLSKQGYIEYIKNKTICSAKKTKIIKQCT